MATGTLAATEASKDVFGAALTDSSGSALADKNGSPLSVGEKGSLGGAVIAATGTLAAIEAIDAFAAAGSISAASPNLSGDFAGTETADTFAVVGKVPTTGTYAASESGADHFAALGSSPLKGTLAALEAADTLAAAGSVGLHGALAASEVWGDSAFMQGELTQLVTMSAFPTIPAGPDSSFYNVQLEDATIRTELEGGYVAARRRHTREPRRTFSTGYTKIPDGDKQLIEEFYDLVGGDVIFDWLNPEDLATYKVRFDAGGLAMKYEGIGPTKLWTIQFKLQEA